ncbi:MAG: hypothetical protein J6A01_09310 [Proteobacteria bacterium]|nr:hypothetical protein [Pseudomonadota bacterium]
MIKRNLYIVLAGIITAGAVLGWSQENVQVSAPELGGAPTVAPSEPGKSYHDAVLSLLNANDLVIGAELQVLATDDEVQEDIDSEARIRLVSPQVGPNLVEEKAAAAAKPKTSALDKLKSNQTLKDAKTLAVVDLAKNAVIEATDAESVDLTGIEETSSGTRYFAKDGKLMLAAWSCVDDSREACLYSMSEARSPLADTIRCDAANQSFVMCDDQQVDSFALFDASECTPLEVSDAIRTALASKTGDSGEFEAGGTKWSFVRAKLNSGCDLTSIASMAEAAVVAAPKSAVISAKPQKRFTIKALGMAIGAGVIMILLGLVCTRRKESEIQTESKPQALKNGDGKQPEKLSDGDENLKASLAAAKEEKAQLLKKLEQAEALSKENAGKLGQMKEELEASKSAFKKEEITRLSLEEEKRRLEDALASKAASNTVVDSPVHFAKGPSNSNIPLQKSNPESEAEANRVTAPVDEHNLAVLRSSEQSHSFFDSLTDDGWDEIADSFDALFTPKKNGSDDASDENGSKVNLGDSVLNLINDTQSAMNSSKWAPPAEKPKEMAGHIDITAAPSLNAPSEGMRGGTVKMAGLARPITKTDVSQKVQAISNVKSSTKSAENVKVVPSYTMKGVAFTAPQDAAKSQSQTQKQNSVDENSLFEALKRRAKDVSEIDMPVSGDPKQSGAFEFNRGLSKSGVFSVTGSRVDIDPLSETEYFKSLYDKYIQTQKECGEVTDKFTLEQFVSRLAREKDRLIKTYKCKNVRFSVYVKDGKASLKATPQK